MLYNAHCIQYILHDIGSAKNIYSKDHLLNRMAVVDNRYSRHRLTVLYVLRDNGAAR